MLKRRLARAAFHLLRRFRCLAQTLLPWSLTHMSFAIPLHKLRETATLVAFYHPQPSYPVHILILPKRAIPSMADLTAQDANLLAEVMLTTQSLVEELGLEKEGYRLIVNGGAYQELQQMHWHLVSGSQR